MLVRSGIVIALCALIVTTYSNARAQDTAPVPESPPAAEAAPDAAGADPASSSKTVLYNLKEDIKRCAGLQDRTVRITCYDQMAGDLGYLDPEKAKREQEILSSIGFWQVGKSTTTFGEARTTLRSESINTIKSASGTERHVHFIIQCTPGKTEAFLDWKTPVTKASQAVMKQGLDITYRIDSDDKIADKWQVSTDRQAIFVPDAIEFVRQMNNKNRLSFEIVPVGDSVQGVHFDIKGIEQAAQELAKACY